jgi:hypothetical protein
MVEWPDSPSPKTVRETTTEEIMELLKPDWDFLPSAPAIPESKSPMKYAVDYKLVDEDGQLMEATDYFITSDEAWDRARELYELSGLEGMITFRAL